MSALGTAIFYQLPLKLLLQVRRRKRKSISSCVCVCVFLRSIQKLEELNVGMENLGEEVKSLTQQCNGNTPASGDNQDLPPVSPERNRTRGAGQLLSSTPQHSAGGAAVHPPNESPVGTQRFVGFVCFHTQVDPIADTSVRSTAGTRTKRLRKATPQVPYPAVPR